MDPVVDPTGWTPMSSLSSSFLRLLTCSVKIIPNIPFQLYRQAVRKTLTAWISLPPFYLPQQPFCPWGKQLHSKHTVILKITLWKCSLLDECGWSKEAETQWNCALCSAGWKCNARHAEGPPSCVKGPHCTRLWGCTCNPRSQSLPMSQCHKHTRALHLMWHSWRGQTTRSRNLTHHMQTEWSFTLFNDVCLNFISEIVPISDYPHEDKVRWFV